MIELSNDKCLKQWFNVFVVPTTFTTFRSVQAASKSEAIVEYSILEWLYVINVGKKALGIIPQILTKTKIAYPSPSSDNR